LGPDLFYQYAKRFRFGVKTGIELAGEVEGVLKHPSRWSKTTIGAIPIGHEVTTTPLQLVAAIAAVANDGLYMKPHLVKAIKDEHDEIIKSFEPQGLDQIIAPETAKRVREILVGAVENGTGKKAMIPGMRVGGKTGTAQKVVGNVYSHDLFYASFIGFAPADNPRLAAVVVFDEPHPNHFGGTVSAPVFKEVIESALRYLDNTGPVGSGQNFVQEHSSLR
jgi:cell division protein FtsI/penicillin-binding protein 2